MKIIQNTNMAFRCPSDLKERLDCAAKEHHLHVSSIIRSACSEWLKRKELERLEAEEDARLSAIVKEMMRFDGVRSMREYMK